jgi:hypothetical protein
MDGAIIQTTTMFAAFQNLVDAIVQSFSAEGSNVGAHEAHADVDPIPAFQVLHTVLTGKSLDIVTSRSADVRVRDVWPCRIRPSDSMQLCHQVIVCWVLVGVSTVAGLGGSAVDARCVVGVYSRGRRCDLPLLVAQSQACCVYSLRSEVVGASDDEAARAKAANKAKRGKKAPFILVTTASSGDEQQRQVGCYYG